MNFLGNKDYLIIKGGYPETTINWKFHTLNLECNDFYEGLPEKVIKTYNFIRINTIFSIYSYVCKLDDDMIINTLIPLHILSDYCGYVYKYQGNRNWHINKCSITSIFNTTPYKGDYVVWCRGGYGYILSKKSLVILTTSSYNYKDDIYEDLCISKILHLNNVFPININIRKYIKSPEHL
jgi:hypothetical protein